MATMALLFGQVGLLRPWFNVLRCQTRNTWKTKRRLTLPEQHMKPSWVNPYIVGDYIKDINPQPEYPESYDLYDHDECKFTDHPEGQDPGWNFNWYYSSPPVRLLLLENIDGVGGKGDIVVVKEHTKKSEFLLSKKAVYASEFNLKYYDELIKNKVSYDRPSSLLSPFTAKDLMKSVFPAFMSESNPWIFSKKHIMSALRQGGLVVPESAVEVPPDEITGPDMKKQYKVLVVHVTLNNNPKERIPTKIMIVHRKTPLKEQFTAGKLQPLLVSQSELLESLPVIEKTIAEVDDEDEFV